MAENVSLDSVYRTSNNAGTMAANQKQLCNTRSQMRQKWSLRQPEWSIKSYCSIEDIQHVVISMGNVANQTVATKDAAKRFLSDVVEVVEKTFPVWEKRLATFIEETPMDFEEKRKMLEVHPIRHYFFAAVIGIEISKIRSLFQTEVSEELLADINELIDELAGRSDQLVSDLVFDIMQRVKSIESDDTKKAHDIAMKRIAELLHLNTLDATKALTNDIVFRQEMAQPIAASMRHWWKAFKGSKQLAQIVPAPTNNSAVTPENVKTFKIAAAQ